MGGIVAPGFFASAQVHVALAVGGVAAAVSAVVGVFTVLRRQSFAGHALTEAAATGGAGLALLGASPLLGFIAGSVAGAGAMEAAGARQTHRRDLATGVVLGAAIGLASLFLYLNTTRAATAGLTQQILFGSIFTVTGSTVPTTAAFSVAALGIVAVVYRPLLLSSVAPDLAAARGLPVRAVEAAYLVALATAVGLSALATGAILSTALLIGPAATALRLTRRMGWAMLAALGLAVGSTWLGVLLAYDSYDWFGGRSGLPVSFCIVSLVLLAYLAAGLRPPQRPARWRTPCSPGS